MTSADYLDGYKVERLGALTVQAKSRTKADRALKDAALNKHPDVNALLDLVCETQIKELTSGTDVGGSAKTKRKTIKIWTATACQAIALERVGEPPRLWRQDIAIVDGSNVMHWDSGQPNLKPLRDVIDLLQKKGREPYVVFDRGAGYKLQGKHLTSTALGEELGRQVQIELAPKYEPADHRILDLAEQLLAPIVSNDHFRDRPEARDIPKIKGFSKHGVTEILKPLP
ncbi:NYN domain-containing protein [Salipiger sp. CCB-MM3]|uniref:NYN domain-containing protein n=1 Tax=Salipiger sp. CCB-MM3 TaxID=1792508 RepID=UPI0012FC8D6D|nr:hypothetical protein [Salipiger sp. CCB-MM3]